MQPSRSWIKDQILILLHQSPKHGYDLLQILNEKAPDLKLTTLYRWLHDMESKNLVHSVILPGPHGPNRRVYKIDSLGEKRLNELIGESVQLVLEFYKSFRRTLLKNNQIPNAKKDDIAPKEKTLFAAFPYVRKEDLDVLFFLSLRCNNTTLEILGKSNDINEFGINYRKVKGNIFELTKRNSSFAEIWLKYTSELEKLPSVIKGCKKALSSKGILYVIVPTESDKKNQEFSIKEYMQGKLKEDPSKDKIHQSKVGSIIKSQFTTCGSVDLFPGLDVYYCIKQSAS